MVFNSQNGKMGLNAQWFGAHTVKDIQKISTATKNYNLIAQKSITNAQKYATTIETCDEKFGAYLKNLNGAKASVAGYSASLVGATIKTVALQAASMALNAALTWVVSLAIQGLISLGSYLWKLVPTTEHLKKQLEETTEKFNELKNTIKSTRDELESTVSGVESIRDEYAVLAQGVDEYGNNVSLTDEEYKKFIQHNNQLAEQFPNLVKGYNSNGVAILGLAGGVQEITNAIDKLIESMQSTANVTLLKSANTDYETIHNQVKNLRDEIAQLRKDAAELPITVERAAGEITRQDYSKAFTTGAEAIYYQRELAAKGISSTILENVETKLPNDVYPQIYQIVAANIEDVQAYELKRAEEIATTANAEYQALMEQIEVKQNELESAVSQFDDYINAYLSSVGNGGFNYAKIESSMGDVGSLIVHSLINNLNMDEYEDVEAFYDAIDEILLKVKKVGDAENWESIQESIQKITDAGNTMSFKALTDEYDNFINLLKKSGASQDVIDSLSAMFDYEGIKNKVAQVKNMVKDEYDHLIDGLSIKDINTAIRYIIDAGDNSLTWDELLQEIKNATPIKTTIEVYTDVNSLASGFDQLDKIYADILNKEDFDWGSILNNKEFTDAFGSLGDSYTDFINTVANSPSDINACQDAFNNLATAYLLNSDILSEVTDETRKVTIAMLEQMGVANAAVLVDERLALAKERTRIETEAGTNATFNQVLELYDEETASRITAQAIYELAIAKLQTNENALLTSSDIAQLEALAEAAGATAESLLNVAKAKSYISQAETLEKQKADLIAKGADPREISVVGTQATNYRLWAEELLNKKITYAVDFKRASYTGGSSTNNVRSSGKTAADRYFDELKYKLETNQMTQEQYLKELDAAYKRFYSNTTEYLEEYAKYSQEVYDGFKDMYKEDLDAQKDSLEKQKDALRDFYDERKKLLEEANEEEDYEKDKSEKLQEINELKILIAKLRTVGTQNAQKRIAELEEELSKAQEDYDEFEKEHILEKALENIEKEYETQEKKIQSQIDSIQDKLDQIDKDTLSVRDAIIDFAAKYGVNLDFAYGNGSTGAPADKPNNNGNNKDIAIGSTIVVKDTATHFSAKSNNVKMKSFVPGGTYEVLKVSGDEVRIGLNGVATGWINKSDIVGYARGTYSAIGGLSRINETGLEMIAAPDGNGNYVNLLPKSKVFTAKATKFLWDLATKQQLPQAMYNSIAKTISARTGLPNISVSQPITIQMGDIIIQGNADDRTLQLIKKAQEGMTRKVLEDIKKLQNKKGL